MIPFAEQRRCQDILNWIDRMTKKNQTGSVHEKGVSGSLDWGQALTRECYGKDWQSTVPESPTESDVIRAMDWEKGNIPVWVETEAT